VSPFFKSKFILFIMTVIGIIVSMYLYNDRISTEYKRSMETRLRMAIIASLGQAPIPIFAQCSSSRTLVEGIYPGRTEIPGGLSIQTDSDVFGIQHVAEAKKYIITVIRKKR